MRCSEREAVDLLFRVQQHTTVDLTEQANTMGAQNPNLEYRMQSQYQAFLSSVYKWFRFGKVSSTDASEAMVLTIQNPNIQNGCFSLGHFIHKYFFFISKGLGYSGHLKCSVLEWSGPFEIRTI